MSAEHCADAMCVCEYNGSVMIGIGYEREPEPREWFAMDADQARTVARQLHEAAAIASEHET